MRILRNNPVARAIATLLLLAVFALLGALPAAPASAAEQPPPLPPISMQGDFYTIGGIESHVDNSSLDIARGTFKNTIGLGTQEFLAEPGKMLVGPDYPADLVAKSGGAVEYLSGLNQKSFETSEPSAVRMTVGGFNLITLGYGDLQIVHNDPDLQRNIFMHLVGHENHGYIILVRGLYEHPKFDRNGTIWATNFEPGHNQFQILGGPNGGFFSEGHFQQVTGTMHTGGGNCGMTTGCINRTAIFVDANTTAITILGSDNGGPWHLLWTNYDQNAK